MPAAAAHRGVREPSRLHRGRAVARHAGGLHWPHPRKVPRQAASRSPPERPDGRGTMSATDLSREGLLKIVRQVWEERDPVPEGLVERMQAVVQTEAILADTDLDYELLVLVERSAELAGARGTAAYTLRFAHDTTEVLLRTDRDDSGGARLDGWIAPAAAMRV